MVRASDTAGQVGYDCTIRSYRRLWVHRQPCHESACRQFGDVERPRSRQPRCRAFRFANVVGDLQTHGVTYDFVRRLRADPSHLDGLGGGTQGKAYVHVDDVVRALLTVQPTEEGSFDFFNVGTGGTITVAQIAELVLPEMHLTNMKVCFGSSPRGWKGVVPVVRLDYTKARATGWRPTLGTEEAIRASIKANVAEVGVPLDLPAG